MNKNQSSLHSYRCKSDTQILVCYAETEEQAVKLAETYAKENGVKTGPFQARKTGLLADHGSPRIITDSVDKTPLKANFIETPSSLPIRNLLRKMHLSRD